MAAHREPVTSAFSLSDGPETEVLRRENRAMSGGLDSEIVIDDTASPTTDPLLLTVRQVAASLGVGRTTVYELIGTGELEVVHIGRSTRVPAAAMTEFVNHLRARCASQP